MATFRVTDPDTGITLRLEGDAPPTESELEEIFKQARPGPLPLRQPEPPPISATSARPAQPSYFAPPPRATEQELVAEIVRPPPSPQQIRREELERERNQLFREMREDTAGKTLTRAGLSIGQAGGALQRMAGGVLGALVPLAIPDLGGSEAPRAFARKIRDEGRKIENRYRELGIDMGGGSLSDITQELGSTALVSAPTIPAAMFGGLPAAAALAGMQSLGSAYDDAVENYKRRGLNQDQADIRAMLPAYLSGVITAGVTAAFGRTGVEALANREFQAEGISQIVKNLFRQIAQPRAAYPAGAAPAAQAAAQAVPKRVGDLMVEVVRQSGWEGLEEMADEIGQNIVAKATYDPERTLGQAVETSIFAGLAGSMLGGAATVGLRGPELGLRRFGRGRRLLSLQQYRESGRRRTQLSRLRTQREIEREMEDITQSIMQVGRRPSAEETGAQAQAPGAQITPEQEEAERLRLRNIAENRLAPVTGAAVEPPQPEAPSATGLDDSLYPVRETPVSKIKLSKDVPQFKGDADPETGVVPGEELKGEAYERVGTAPIVVWERLNGDLEVITGRHKLDLARRLGEKTVPTQIVREADGWDRSRAARLDAEANIRDGTGTVADYANYFRNSAVTRAQSEARGLLSRAKGRDGFSIGKFASEELYRLFARPTPREVAEGKSISAEIAAVIAETAPLDTQKQSLGIRRAQAGDRPGAIKARLQIERARTESPIQTDLFGNPIFDESNSQRQADEVDLIRRELRSQINAVRGAANNPEAARKLGVDVRDPQGVRKRIEQLQAELNQWDGDWWLNRDLVNKLAERTVKKAAPKRPEFGKPTITTTPPTAEQQQVAVSVGAGVTADPNPTAGEFAGKWAFTDRSGKNPYTVYVEPGSNADTVRQRINEKRSQEGEPPLPSPAPAAAPEPPAKPKEPKYKGYTKQDIAELKRLRKQLRDSFTGETGLMAGGFDPIKDPPRIAILTRMALIHGKAAGVRTFDAFVRLLKQELPDLFRAMRHLIPGAWATAGTSDPTLQEVSRAEAERVIQSVETEGQAPKSEEQKRLDRLMAGIDRYMSWRRGVKGYGKNISPTRDIVFTSLRVIARFFAERGKDSWLDLTTDDIKSWREVLANDPKKDAEARKKYVGNFGQLLDFLKKDAAGDPTLWLATPEGGGPAEPNRYLSETQIDDLLTPSPEGATIQEIQADALMALYYYTGLRNQNLAAVKLSQLKLGQNDGWIRNLPVSKQIVRWSFYLPPAAVAPLRRYLAVRDRFDNANTDWLFPGVGEKGHIAQQTVGDRIAERVNKLSITEVGGENVTAHTFRRTLTQHLRERVGLTEEEVDKIIPHVPKGSQAKFYYSEDYDKLAVRVGELQHNKDFLARQAGAPRPQLRPGEQGTGDLFQGPEAPFNLAGETGTDAERIAREQAAAEAARREAEQRAAQQQQQLPGTEPPAAPPAPPREGAAPTAATEGQRFIRETVDEAGAQDIAGLRRLIDNPELRLPEQTRRVLHGLINSNLHKRLPGVAWAIADYIQGGLRGEYRPDARLIRFLRWTDADVPIHEFFHHLWYYLQPADRDFIRSMWRDSIRKNGAEGDIGKGMSSDEAVERGISNDLYHLINEREFFTWMMTDRAMSEFDRPEQRGFINRLRQYFYRLWTSLKNATGIGGAETRAENLWHQLLTGKYDYLPEQAKQWANVTREGAAPPPEPEYFQNQDEATAKIQYASMEIPRLVRNVIEDRRAAERRLDALAFDTGQFKAARQKIDELVTAAQREARNSNDPFWEIPGNMPTASDELLADKLRMLGIDFDADALIEMQKDIAFENASMTQYRRKMRLAEVRRWIKVLADLGLPPGDYGELTQTEERLQRAIFRAAADDDRDNALGLTIEERSEQIRDSERTKPDDQAKANSLNLPFVRETFLDPLESGERLADRFGRTMQFFRSAMADPNLPEHYKRAIANEMSQRILEFERNAGNFDKFYENERLSIAAAIRKLQTKLTDAKVRRGMGEILLLDALRAADDKTTDEQRRGLTGTWATREAVEYLIDSYGAIVAFANNLRTKYPNGGAQALVMRLMAGLSSPDPAKFDQSTGYGGSVAKVLDAIKAETDPTLKEIKRAAGISDEALARILFVLNRSKPFADAINLILQYGEMKLAREPALRLRRIADLIAKGDQFSKAEAQGMIEQLVTEAREAKDENEGAMRLIDRDLRREQVALKSLDYGKELFDAVRGTREQPNPEYIDVRRQAEDRLNVEERMILESGGGGHRAGETSLFFKPFKIKTDDVDIDQQQESIDATDSILLNPRNASRIERWIENAEKYVAAFETAEAQWRADPNNPSPEALGFDRRTYLGLVRALERHAFRDVTNLFWGSTASNNMLEQWKLGWRWFRQFLRGIKQARGPVGRDVQAKGVAYGNNLVALRGASQTNKVAIYKAQKEAIDSHPEFRGDLQRYAVEVFNEMASEGRKFGSALRPGFTLPVSGRLVTAEDIAYLQTMRRYNDDIRQRVTEREGRGIIVEQGRGRDYRVFRRDAASVGDYGLQMHVENRGDDLIKGMMSAYEAAEQNNQLPTSAVDLTSAGTNPVVSFWNNNAGSLIRHILDAGRAYRLMDQTNPMLAAERAAALELMDANNPRIIQSLDDAVALISKNFPRGSGLDVRTYVADELLNELQQYFRNARSYRSKQGELQRSEGAGGISLASEFTQRASQFLFPSNWYDYGAVTDSQLMMLTARAMHEPIMQFAASLERLSASLGKELKNNLERGQPTHYKSDREATRVKKIIDGLLGDLKSVWRMDNPDNERWAVEFPPDLIKASLLANAPVSIRNVVTGAGMAVIRMMALNRFWGGLGILDSLRYIHKIAGRIPLDLLVSQQSPIGRTTVRFLKGPGRKLLPSFMSDLAERLVDAHINNVSENNRLGYSIRQPFIQTLRQIWGRTGIYQSSEQARRERGVVGTGRRVLRNVGRSFATLFQQVGPEFFDKIINAEALAWSDGIERTLRNIAEVYGEARSNLGRFDPTNPAWQITPEEFSRRIGRWAKQKNLADFRDFLIGADISLEKVLNDYFQRVQSNRERGIEEPPRMFTDDQLAAIRRAVLREFNAADALNRPTAMQTSRLYRMIATFQGWITDFLLKLTGSINGARDQTTLQRLITSLPTILGLGTALTIYGLYSGGMTDWYRRRFQGATQRQVTMFNKEFWANWSNAREAMLTAMLSQLGYYGDAALFAKGVVVNNRGYDPAGRVLAIGILNDLFNTMRGMWNLRHDPSNMINPVRDFVTKYTAGAREIMTALNPEHKAVREYRGANSVIGYFAEQEGFMTERTAGNVKPGVYYSATSGIREDISSAMMQQEPKDLEASYNRLVNYYREKGVERPEQNARRDFMMMHPAIRGFQGKRPTPDEWDRVYSRMTSDQRAAVDKAISAWDWASRRLGIDYNPLTAQAGAAGINLGGGAGMLAGLSAPGGRSSSRRTGTGIRRASVGRGRGRRLRGRSRRLRLRTRRRRTGRLRIARLRTPRLRGRRLRLPRPRLPRLTTV